MMMDTWGAVHAANLSYTPHALPMFKEPMPGQAPNHGKVRPRKDPIATKIPQIPTPGVGGALGGSGGTLLTQLIMKDHGMIGDKNWRLQDPRAAILRHAKARPDATHCCCPCRIMCTRLNQRATEVWF